MHVYINIYQPRNKRYKSVQIVAILQECSSSGKKN